MYIQQPHDTIDSRPESYFSRAYRAAKRAALISTAAAITYLGFGASPQVAIPKAYAQRATPVNTVRSSPELSSLISQDKKPDAAQQEKDLAAKAENLYKEGNAWQTLHSSKPLYGIDRLKVFQESYNSFIAAEKADVSSEKFKDSIAKSQDMLTLILVEYLTGEKDAAKAGEAYSLVKGDVKSDADSKKRLAELLKKFKIDPDAKQDPPKELTPEQKQEQNFEVFAKLQYKSSVDAQDKFSDKTIDSFKNAYSLYKSAEDADPSSKKFGDYLDEKIPDWLAFIAVTRMERETDSKKAKEWFDTYSAFDGKDCFTTLKVDAHKQKLDGLLAKHGIKHEPYFVKPQDPPVKPDQKPDQNPNQKPDQKPDEPKKEEKHNPYSADRITANAEAGSRKSTQDRSVSLDAKVGGFQVIGHGARNKFREATSKDKIIEKEFGLYAGIDFDRIFGVPLDLSASFDERTVTRDSFGFGETDSPLFNIKTFTDTMTEEATRYLAARASFDLGEFKLGVTGFNKIMTTDVDVLTRLEVINKSDPSGNYVDFIANNQSFETNTMGGQFLLEVPVSDRFSMGTLATLEFTDLEDFNRDIDLYRFHLFGKYRSINDKFGLNALIGEGLLDDSGEEQDGWKKGEFNLVAAYQLSDSLLLGGRFTYLTNPHGALFFLLGKNEGALDALLEQYWMEGMAELDLLKHMSEEQQKVYLLGRRHDLVRGLADHNRLMLLGDIGAARVNRPIDGESVEFSGRVTLFLPIEDFTLTITPYIDNADLYRRFGAELTGQKKGSRWSFGVDVAKEEDFSGRLEEEEDIRGMFWARYALGPKKEEPKDK